MVFARLLPLPASSSLFSSSAQRGFLLPLLLSLLVLVVLGGHTARAEVVGIDVGTKFIKIAIAKRGSLPSIVLNKESKRKTEFVVQFTGTSRHFGSIAVSNAAKNPTSTFFNLKTLIGKHHDDEVAVRYAQDFGLSVIADHVRGFLRIRLANDRDADSYTVEELVAMIFAHVRELIVDETNAGPEEPINAVLTVPPFFNEAERQVLIESAQLAKINVISLLHDTTAVAINYASTRVFNAPETMIFYDIGAGSTTATMVKFSGKSVKIPLKVDVLGTAYDRHVGGAGVDRILVDILIKQFVSEHPETEQALAANRESQVRLLREAERVKHALSVNKETGAFLESLHDNHALDMVVKRDMLEARLETDYKKSILEPILKLVSAAPAGSGVDALVLFGGGPRVPAIQKWLQELPGIEKIQRHVDGDEAAALGAVLYGATKSMAFRVRPLEIRDRLPYSIGVGNQASGAEVLFDHTKDYTGAVRNVTIGVSHVDFAGGGTDARVALWGDGKDKLGEIVIKGMVQGKFIEAQVAVELNQNGLLKIRGASVTTQTKIMLLAARNTTEVHAAEFVPAYPVLSDRARNEFNNTLEVWYRREKTTRDRADAHNALESAVYNVRDKLEGERLVKLTAEEERSKVEKLRLETAEWLEINEASAETAQFVDHLTTLNAAFQELHERVERWLSLLRNVRTFGVVLNDTKVRKWADKTDEADTYNVTALVEKLSELRGQVDAKEEEERKDRERVRQEREALLAKMREAEEERRRKKAAAATAAVTDKNSTTTAKNDTASSDGEAAKESAELDEKEKEPKEKTGAEEASTPPRSGENFADSPEESQTPEHAEEL